MLENSRNDWKAERQWQDNGKTMIINRTKKTRVFGKFHFPGVSTFSVIFLFFCHVFVMFHCFPLCFHDSNVWCVMFNCFFFQFSYFCSFVFFTFYWFLSLFHGFLPFLVVFYFLLVFFTFSLVFFYCSTVFFNFFIGFDWFFNDFVAFKLD